MNSLKRTSYGLIKAGYEDNIFIFTRPSNHKIDRTSLQSVVQQTAALAHTDYVREHNVAVNRLDVNLGRTPIKTDYAPGEVRDVTQHDGSVLRLKKIAADYVATDRNAAATYIHEHHARGEIVTGLLYIDPEAIDLHGRLGTTRVPLNALGTEDLPPRTDALAHINAELR